MQQPNHQTAKLAKGKHQSPDHGVCVMELASMLAGEPFSDHPVSVSPTIAAFMRQYNDVLDDARRQDLYAYAAKAVGTVGSEELEHRRIEILSSWADSMLERRSRRSFVAWFRRRGLAARCNDASTAAKYAIQAIPRLTDETHASVLSLVDEMIDSPSAPEEQPNAALDLQPVALLGVEPEESMV